MLNLAWVTVNYEVKDKRWQRVPGKKDTLAPAQPFLLTGGSLKHDAQALHFPALV